MVGYRPIIKQIAADGRGSIAKCVENTKIVECSISLSNITNSAIDRGQVLLDDLGDCSRKNGMAVIACYKNIIATDVIPVKLKLLEAIRAHKHANREVIEIRKAVNVCIDENIQKSRNLMEKTLKDALSCQ